MARVDFDRVTFPGSRGVELAGRLDLPSREPRASAHHIGEPRAFAHHIGEPRAFALFAHCFTCGKDVVAASRISGALAREGIAVLRFDFTGLGSSEGDFSNTDFSSNVDDLVAAADMLRSRYAAPSLLIGHSLGGAAALVAAHRVPELTAVVTIAAPSDPEHVAGLLGPETLGRISDAGSAEVTLAGRRFTIRSGFIEDVRGQNLARSLEDLGAALLLLHSPTDRIVGIEHAARLYGMARHPKSFVAIDGADHMLTSHADAQYVARLVAAWSSRYLPGPASPGEQPSGE